MTLAPRKARPGGARYGGAFVLCAVLTLPACGQAGSAPDEAVPTATASAESAPASSAASPSAPGTWDMVSSGEGDGLFFAAAEGEPSVVHLFCPAGGGLLVNVGAFEPIGSEERMTFGSGRSVVTLVADPSGDDLRGGVSGEGPVPAELLTLLTGAEGVAVNYGAQDAGPLPPVPQDMAGRFVTGCTD